MAEPLESGSAGLTVVVPSRMMVIVPVGVSVLNDTLGVTAMVIMSVAPGAGVATAVESVVAEGTIEGGEPTVTVTVPVEGALEESPEYCAVMV